MQSRAGDLRQLFGPDLAERLSRCRHHLAKIGDVAPKLGQEEKSLHPLGRCLEQGSHGRQTADAGKVATLARLTRVVSCGLGTAGMCRSRHGAHPIMIGPSG